MQLMDHILNCKDYYDQTSHAVMGLLTQTMVVGGHIIVSAQYQCPMLP